MWPRIPRLCFEDEMLLFRPKYFHEVHGFIFVVDASDIRRMDETASVFAEIVASDKVQVRHLQMILHLNQRWL